MSAFFKLSFITLILALGTGLRANSYWGTITQTVTHSDSSYYQVGMVVQGWYCYEADSADGIFTGRDSRWELPGQPMTLKGEVCGFFGLFDLLGTLTVGDSFGYLHYTSLTVEDGEVAAFNMDGESGGSDYRFYFDHFKCTELMNGRTVEGLLSFGAPTLKSAENVPDGGNTLFGVCAGFVVLGIFARWRSQKLAVSERAYVRVRQSP
ncbi:MAG: hypothetical protein QM715_09425 [Nibricoccus sp.]